MISISIDKSFWCFQQMELWALILLVLLWNRRPCQTYHLMTFPPHDVSSPSYTCQQAFHIGTYWISLASICIRGFNISVHLVNKWIENPLLKRNFNNICNKLIFTHCNVTLNILTKNIYRILGNISWYFFSPAQWYWLTQLLWLILVFFKNNRKFQ